MKHLIQKVTLTLLTSCVLFNSCKKDPCDGCQTNSLANNINKPPIAVAGPDQTIILPTDSILLDGSASNDPDGRITAWQWKKIAGPSSFNIVNANSAITEVTNLVKGNYEFLLKVTDSLGEESLDTIRIIVDTILPPPPPPGSRPPSAYSGYDFIVHLPADSGYLYGSAYDPDNNIASIQWSKIVGPPSFNIVRPDSVFSKLTNLQRGVYQFEIKVVDNTGLTAKDTNTVIVGELPANPQEIVLENQPWGCHWDCYIQIHPLYNYIPPDRVFKVLIKRDNSSTWIEVVPGAEMIQSSIYGYSLRKGMLWIHQTFHTGFDISDTPAIKIIY